MGRNIFHSKVKTLQTLFGGDQIFHLVTKKSLVTSWHPYTEKKLILEPEITISMKHLWT